MANVNKFGLSQDIPDPVKREVRQRCGFGCVVCGNALYQYEHVDPVFAEAKEHDPNCIVLLCGGCHDRVTRKLLSKDTIKLKSKSPKCIEQGFSFGPFDLGITPPEIIIGTFKSKNTICLIRVYGDEILSIKPPEALGHPFYINAFLCDRDGREILKVVNNEWITPSRNWDVEVVGTQITIRKKLGDIILSLRSEPPHKLIVERLDMVHRGTKITCKEGKNIEVLTASGQYFKSSKMESIGHQFGIDVHNNGLSIGVGSGGVRIGKGIIGQLPSEECVSFIEEYWKKDESEGLPIRNPNHGKASIIIGTEVTHHLTFMHKDKNLLEVLNYDNRYFIVVANLYNHEGHDVVEVSPERVRSKGRHCKVSCSYFHENQIGILIPVNKQLYSELYVHDSNELLLKAEVLTNGNLLLYSRIYDDAGNLLAYITKESFEYKNGCFRSYYEEKQ